MDCGPGFRRRRRCLHLAALRLPRRRGTHRRRAAGHLPHLPRVEWGPRHPDPGPWRASRKRIARLRRGSLPDARGARREERVRPVACAGAGTGLVAAGPGALLPGSVRGEVRVLWFREEGICCPSAASAWVTDVGSARATGLGTLPDSGNRVTERVVRKLGVRGPADADSGLQPISRRARGPSTHSATTQAALSTTPCSTHFHPAVSVSIAPSSELGPGPAHCSGDAWRDRPESRACDSCPGAPPVTRGSLVAAGGTERPGAAPGTCSAGCRTTCSGSGLAVPGGRA